MLDKSVCESAGFKYFNMRKIVGIIPCDNGLGHITRSIKLASYLSKQYKIVFFINKKR